MNHTDSNDYEYWLALARIPTLGAVTYARLLSQFGSPKAVFQASSGEWLAAGLKTSAISALQQPEWAKVKQDLAWLQANPNNHLLTLTDPNYPPLLRTIHDPPPILFVHGDVALLSQPQIAMVGTRHPSRQGEEIAREFAEHLAQAGFVITSGMAFGIDAAAHLGALQATGYTLAVTGTGLDRVYPRQHRELAHRIAEKGALVSELFPGTPAIAGQFPRRNRIISGLSLGVLVVEASSSSGSLITAHLAVEQGRDVFAIPGSIRNPQSRGCHTLIKQGAKLVETANDVMEELLAHLPLNGQTIGFDFPLKTISPPTTSFSETQTVSHSDSMTTDDPDYARLLAHLVDKPITVDSLVELSGLTVEAVSSMLLILELRGMVASQAGGMYFKTR
ncbi:DNA-processing protein DprA [Thioflexithrix psekupsensis]|uniref:DNA protecting protein DprA n=1 Tax=Thioflexithrix psekupsensis TaxID=1570016 RepID=A0A251XA72_9GAMM|nr:DNA-processing protein DprA [Thioflexithrix psekupsensis]OUD15331.1 DNA protecting protein DprA [Thioflexithrix psekupsensis]